MKPQSAKVETVLQGPTVLKEVHLERYTQGIQPVSPFFAIYTMDGHSACGIGVTLGDPLTASRDELQAMTEFTDAADPFAFHRAVEIIGNLKYITERNIRAAILAGSHYPHGSDGMQAKQRIANLIGEKRFKEIMKEHPRKVHAILELLIKHSIPVLSEVFILELQNGWPLDHLVMKIMTGMHTPTGGVGSLYEDLMINLRHDEAVEEGLRNFSKAYLDNYLAESPAIDRELLEDGVRVAIRQGISSTATRLAFAVHHQLFFFTALLASQLPAEPKHKIQLCDHTKAYAVEHMSKYLKRHMPNEAVQSMAELSKLLNDAENLSKATVSQSRAEHR